MLAMSPFCEVYTIAYFKIPSVRFLDIFGCQDVHSHLARTPWRLLSPCGEGQSQAGCSHSHLMPLWP